MQILNTIKQFLTLKPMITQFELAKVYHKSDKHAAGKLYIQANKKLEIVSIKIEVVEQLHISKDEIETTVAWSKVSREAVELGRFEKYELPFEIALKFPRQTKWERKNYKGDLGPLNKATDKSRIQLYTYKVIASIKFRGKKDLIVHEEQIRME